MLWALPLEGQVLSDYLSQARSGNPRAQYNAAQCYLYGWGTSADSTQWHHFLRLAAEGGEHRAAEQLALHYEHQGIGVLASYWRGEPSTLPYDYTYLSYDEGCYYGEVRRGTRDGYGIYVWDNGTSHTGRWEDGESYGMGYTSFAGARLYCYNVSGANGPGAIILTDSAAHFAGVEGSCRYVGYLENGLPSGTGVLYSREGKLLYAGPFNDGHTTSTDSGAEDYIHYRWTNEQLSSGDTWEGESYGGVRSGFGIYRWADGSWWCGFWNEGLREGAGLYVRADGAIMTGRWDHGELTTEE